MAPPTCEGLKNVREETELLIKHHCPCKMPSKIEYACTLWPSWDCEGTLGHMHQEAHPKLSPTALFIVTKHWTWSKGPVAVDWTSYLYILTVEYLQGRAGVSIFLISSAWSDFTLGLEISLLEALHDGNEPKVQIRAFALWRASHYTFTSTPLTVLQYMTSCSHKHQHGWAPTLCGREESHRKIHTIILLLQSF